MSPLLLDTELLITIAQIIMIDILLGGDNAVVIALACRRLSPELRRRGVFWGAMGAIVLRVVLVFFALSLLALPLLKITGALLLLWIGIKLLLPETEAEREVPASTHLLGAIRTIVIADAVMSLDNVVAVSAAADGNLQLVALGILISVPIIVWGSRLVLLLMDRFPIVITFGAALLGWIAGEIWLSDQILAPYHANWPVGLHYVSATSGALLVVGIGKLLARRRAPARAINPR